MCQCNPESISVARLVGMMPRQKEAPSDHLSLDERSMKRVLKLRDEARRCFRVADLTADNRVASALLAYACELEQRARLIENSKKPTAKSPPPAQAAISRH